MIVYHEVKHEILTPELESLKLYPLGDLHVGANAFDAKALERKVREIAVTDNALVLLCGDLINNSIKSSVGDVYDETMTPEMQIDAVVDMLSPIRDRVAGIVRGNHELRSVREVCADPMKYIARGLGCEACYFRDAAYLTLPFGRKQRGNQKRLVYSLYLVHGSDGGSTAGGKLNGMARFGRVVYSDIVVAGHTHMPSTYKDSLLVPDLKNKRLRRHETTFVNCGTYLDLESYAVRRGFAPSVIGSPVIVLDGREKRVNVIS